MMPKFALSMLVALAVCAPLQEAAAQDSTLGGALFGGAAGAIVGGAIGGGRGAAIGAIVGAGTGAAIGAQGETPGRRLSLLPRRLLRGNARGLAGRFAALLRGPGAICTATAPVLCTGTPAPHRLRPVVLPIPGPRYLYWPRRLRVSLSVRFRSRSHCPG
jgi:hypothetical protein